MGIIKATDGWKIGIGYGLGGADGGYVVGPVTTPNATLKTYTECATIWTGLKWNSSSTYASGTGQRKPAGVYISYMFDDNWTTSGVPSLGTIPYGTVDDNVGFSFIQKSRFVREVYDDDTTQSSMNLGLKYHEVIYRNTTTGKSHRVTFSSDGVAYVHFMVDGVERSALPVGEQFQLSPLA